MINVYLSIEDASSVSWAHPASSPATFTSSQPVCKEAEVRQQSWEHSFLPLHMVFIWEVFGGSADFRLAEISRLKCVLYPLCAVLVTPQNKASDLTPFVKGFHLFSYFPVKFSNQAMRSRSTWPGSVPGGAAVLYSHTYCMCMPQAPYADCGCQGSEHLYKRMLRRMGIKQSWRWGLSEEFRIPLDGWIRK